MNNNEQEKSLSRRPISLLCLRYFTLAILATILLSGCGSSGGDGGGNTITGGDGGESTTTGGGGDDSTVTTQPGANKVLISGRAAKGTILSARIRATQIIDGQLSGIQKDAVLGSNGDFSVSMPRGLVYLEVIPKANSTTQDEATGVAVALPPEFKFRAAADLTDSTATTVILNITPFSEAGVALAEKSGGLTTANINKANSGIANILGFDHLGTKPIQSSDTAELASATTNEKKLSVLNAAVSNMATTDALGCGVKASYGQTIDCTVAKLADQFQMNNAASVLSKAALSLQPGTTANSTPMVLLGDTGYQFFLGGIANAVSSGVSALANTAVDLVQDGLAFSVSAATYAKNITETAFNTTTDALGNVIYISRRQETKLDYQTSVQGKDYLITNANNAFKLAIISDLVYKDEWVNGDNPGAILDVRSRTTSGGYSAPSDLTVLNWAEYGISPQEAWSSSLQWNVFYDSEVMIFSYRGTESNSLLGFVQDFATNINTLVCQIGPGQYKTALQQFDSLMANPKFNTLRGTKKIVLTGHSLGGGIASYITRKRPIVDWSVGFNPAPLCVAEALFSGESPFFNDPRIFRISIKNEPISTWPVVIITGFRTYFPGNPPLVYPNPFVAVANPLDSHFMSTILFALDAAKDLCTPGLCPQIQNTTQVIQTPNIQTIPISVNGIQNSYSTSVTPYSPAISLSGINLSAINQISWSCTQPNGAICPGSPYIWTPNDWTGKVDIFNDTSIKVYPGLLALGDTPGTYNWIATFSALNSSPVSIPFSVTYQPQLATGIIVDGLSSAMFTLGTTSISATTNPVVAALTVSGKNLDTVARIEWRWNGAATGSKTWLDSDSTWGSKVTYIPDDKLTLSPTVVEESSTWSGTVIWTGTLLDAAGASQNITFTVVYQPPATVPPPSPCTPPQVLTDGVCDTPPITATPPTPTGTATSGVIGTSSGPGPVTPSSTVNVNWNTSSGAVDYNLIVTNITNNTQALNIRLRGNTSTTALTAGHQYSWKVAACNTTGCSSYTAAQYFQTPGATPPTPTLSSIFPNPITQGTSFQNVTFSGSGFTASSWTQFSVSGGSAWAWATSAPTYNNPNSMTVGINNTVAQTIFWRVCTSNGSTSCSASRTITVQAATPSLVINGVASSFFGTGQKTISLSGNGFNSITQISWTCTNPDGTTCTGSPYVWKPGTARWNNVTITSDTVASVFPTFLVASDPPGTYNWSVTFSGGGQSVTKFFTAIK